MRTLLQQASEGGHAVEFRIPADLAPITLAFTACTTTGLAIYLQVNQTTLDVWGPVNATALKH